ncbi:hypothetical protein WJX72_005937 [[Myrmecia] bisecta]|uniref:ABC transporter domain-containing protein n=1 Tax=[Myrmecia] bisecta TaxID=41462 RepID=A0AAW1R7D3_9CHLO
MADFVSDKQAMPSHVGVADVLARDATCGLSFSSARRDQADLVAAVTSEKDHKKIPKLQRPQLQKMASKIMLMGQDKDKGGFLERFQKVMARHGIDVPTVTVEYHKLCVEADALIGSAGIPSLTNVALGTLKTLVGLGGLSTKPMSILKDVSGVLRPGRITLLLGPPGAGKTVYLQALGGQLKPGQFLRINGSVKYNGHTKEEFVLARTAALVDQYDDHIAALTVRETLEFAHECQMGHKFPEFYPVDKIKAARAAKASVAAPLTSAASQDLTNVVPDQQDAEGLQAGSEVEAAADNQPTAQPGGAATAAVEAEDAEFEQLLAEIWGTGVKTELIIRLLGLRNCADTVVGGQLMRGISGGERKRVTSAEMLVGPKKVLLMDEISTGLDSATTFNEIDYLRGITHVMGLTTVVSLLQPPPEVYNLFDDVLLLTDGQVCFHGPMDQAIPFFASQGFVCPLRKDPASFLQEVTTPKGQLQFASPELKRRKGVQVAAMTSGNEMASAAQILSAEAPPSDALLEAQLAAGHGRTLMVTVEEISQAFYNKTSYGQQMLEMLNKHPFDKRQDMPGALTRTHYPMSFLSSLKLVTVRSMMLTLRDKSLVRGRLIQVAVMALIIGSLFAGLAHTASVARSYFGVSFLSVMFLAMGAMPQLSIGFFTKGVFFKQRNARFFQPASYTFAQYVTQLPFALLEAVVYSIIVYFLVGYYRAAGYYFLFYFIILSAMLVMASLMRLLASVMPSMVIANAAGGLMILLLVITSGYTITRTSIPPWFIWAYWISPFAYALRALVINEMTSPDWSAPVSPGASISVGVASLESFGFYTDRKWIWVGIGYNIGLSLLLTVFSTLALTYLHPPKARPSVADEPKPEGRLTGSFKRISFRKPKVDMVDPEAPANGASIQSSLPFEPVTLVFRDLRYFVDAPAGAAQTDNSSPEMKGKLELLKGITGFAPPGVLTALMGGSGAGKTTLMDAVAGRKTIGSITGDILVNGYPKEQRSWARVVGYVEQNDIHSPQATVREALLFSARLRIPEAVSYVQIRAYVDEVIEIVELQSLQHTTVGIPNQSGLSVEQRKRLTIAVELVANPSVVFMDEPTSGLDARAAAIVMRSVKNVSRNGRSVVVTIHQPSIEIFESFDALVLLQRGGKLIYFGTLGHESSHLISYLEAVPGVAPIKPGYNPATWMLEVTGGSMSTGAAASSADFPTIYKESELYKQNMAQVERLIEEGKRDHKPLSMSARYAISKLLQARTLIRKFTTAYWRSPAYNLTRILMTVTISLLYGLMFLDKGALPATGAGIANVQSVMGVIYSSCTFQGMFNLITVLPVVGYERAVLYRERAAAYYSNGPYALATGIVEIPYLISQMCIFMPISYWLIGFQASWQKYWFFSFVFLMIISMFTFFGQLLVFITPSQALAQILGGALNTLWNIFNGFLMPYPVMPRGWRWLNRISPTTWCIYALAVDQLGDSPQTVTAFINGSQQTVTVGKFMEEYFGYKYSFKWYAVLILGGFILVFRILAAVALKTISFERR